MSRARAVLAVSGAVLLAATTTGCGVKSDAQAAVEQAKGVKVGVGVSGDRIHLGVLTDESGPFAPVGTEIGNAQKTYWSGVDADGGVCGKFGVDLEVQDHGYNVQRAVSLYSTMSTKTLALSEMVGSAHTAALLPKFQEDDLLAIARTGAASFTKTKNTMVAGATYDIEIANVVDYLVDHKQISPASTVAIVYLEGEYGETGLQGAKRVAANRNLKLIEYRVKPTDSDMSAQVTDAKAKGASALIVSASPTQLAAVAAAAASQKFDVPVAVNNPAWSPSLLKTPAGDFLRRNVYIGYPVAPFGSAKADEIRAEYLKAFPGTDPTLQVVMGYGEGMILKQILDKACELGDLTRAGVMRARDAVGVIDTEGVFPPLDFSTLGQASTPKTFILKAADQPGGATLLEGPYQGPSALPSK